MTEQEREKLVLDLTHYVAMMAPHQQARMGGKLIVRALEALKSMRVLDPKQVARWHQKGLLTSIPEETSMKDGPDNGPASDGSPSGN